MTIKLVKIRAKITIGSSLTVETPFIQSFNVRKSRGQISTFDSSLKVASSKISGSSVGGLVNIKAGANGSLKEIYTGILKKSTISPCWDDPGYVLLNISGVDVLSKLEGKKYTRRSRATKSSWVTINSVTREGLRDGKFESNFDVIKTTPIGGIDTDEVIGSAVQLYAEKVYTSSGEPTCFIEATPIVVDEEEVVV